MAHMLPPLNRPQPPQRLPLQYEIARELGIVTLHPANLPAAADPNAYAVDLDESDLIQMLVDLQTGDASLAELAGQQ